RACGMRCFIASQLARADLSDGLLLRTSPTTQLMENGLVDTLEVATISSAGNLTERALSRAANGHTDANFINRLTDTRTHGDEHPPCRGTRRYEAPPRSGRSGHTTGVGGENQTR